LKLGGEGRQAVQKKGAGAGDKELPSGERFKLPYLAIKRPKGQRLAKKGIREKKTLTKGKKQTKKTKKMENTGCYKERGGGGEGAGFSLTEGGGELFCPGVVGSSRIRWGMQGGGLRNDQQKKGRA